MHKAQKHMAGTLQMNRYICIRSAVVERKLQIHTRKKRQTRFFLFSFCKYSDCMAKQTYTSYFTFEKKKNTNQTNVKAILICLWLMCVCGVWVSEQLWSGNYRIEYAWKRGKNTYSSRIGVTACNEGRKKILLDKYIQKWVTDGREVVKIEIIMCEYVSVSLTICHALESAIEREFLTNKWKRKNPVKWLLWVGGNKYGRHATKKTSWCWKTSVLLSLLVSVTAVWRTPCTPHTHTHTF